MKIKLLGLKICLKGLDWIEFIVLGFKLINIVCGIYLFFENKERKIVVGECEKVSKLK